MSPAEPNPAADAEQALDKHWAKFIPDPDIRAVWRAAFGDKSALSARGFYSHFTDPAAAHAWSRTVIRPELAAILHQHGITPDKQALRAVYVDALYETGEGALHSSDEVNTRIGLLALHPHLPRADRDAIAAARLTLTEALTMISTGTYDRDNLALIAALT